MGQISVWTVPGQPVVVDAATWRPEDLRELFGEGSQRGWETGEDSVGGCSATWETDGAQATGPGWDQTRYGRTA